MSWKSGSVYSFSFLTLGAPLSPVPQPPPLQLTSCSYFELGRWDLNCHPNRSVASRLHDNQQLSTYLLIVRYTGMCCYLPPSPLFACTLLDYTHHITLTMYQNCFKQSNCCAFFKQFRHRQDRSSVAVATVPLVLTS